MLFSFHTQTHFLKDLYNMQDSIFTNEEFTINHIKIKSILFIHVIQLFEYSFKIFIKYRQNKVSDPYIQVSLIM